VALTELKKSGDANNYYQTIQDKEKGYDKNTADIKYKNFKNCSWRTWWNKIIHLFEYGSKNSPEKLNTFEGFYNANKTQIEDRFKLHMMDSIQKAINRNRFLEKKGKGLKR
jgi:hypothetical protein